MKRVVHTAYRAVRNAFFALATLGMASTLLANTASAASIYHCASDNQRCVIRLEAGIIGDPVQVLDEKARAIAHGRIIKRKGAYAIIALSNVTKAIRKGYPVIVNIDNRNSNLQWAASFSDQE